MASMKMAPPRAKTCIPPSENYNLLLKMSLLKNPYMRVFPPKNALIARLLILNSILSSTKYHIVQT